ncbi:hypothetical protein [Emergencia timonensis]|uniref:hypothetical protein n=1 Tax=Emergencia timonensis TaxID=1776384 RepID=UPI0039963F07
MSEVQGYYTNWDIVRLSRDEPEDFMELIYKILSDKNYDEAVRILKKSEIAINKFGGGKSNNKAYKKICEEFNNIKGVTSIDNFLVDVETINGLYKTFYENYMTPLEDCIPQEFQFSALLINLQLGMTALAFSEENSAAVDIIDGALETLVSHATAVIKFFCYKNYILKDIIIPESILNYSSKHFESAQIRKSLDDLSILWSHYGLRLYKNTLGQITFNLDESKDIFAKNSGQLTYLDIKNNKMGRQMIESLLTQKKDSYVSDAVELINEYYNIEDLNQKLGGIPLIEYINAYKVINELGVDFTQGKRNSDKYNIYDYLIVIRDHKIKKKMLKEGVSPQNIDYMLAFLTFSAKDSIDLYDTPLFKLGKRYVIIPFIASSIEPAAAIFSNLNSRNIEFNIKGNNFEQKIKDILSKSDVKYNSYKKIVDREEFQCDLVFRLNDTLYFCEIKHFKPPLTFWDYAVAKDKLYQASLQLNRIYDFYSSPKQLSEIMEDFHISSKPSNIKKKRLIVTNILMGSEYTFNGVDVTTEYKFYTYFNQIKPAIHEGRFGQMRTVELDVFKAQNSDDISSNDFEEYIKNNVLTNINKSRFMIRSTYYHDLNLLYKEYSLSIGTFTKLN